MLSVEQEFGLSPDTFGDSSGSSSSAIGIPSGIGTSAQSAAQTAWFQHPTLAVVGIVAITAALLHSAAKPLSAKASGNVGPAKGSIEGSI